MLVRLQAALSQFPDQVNVPNSAGWTPLRYVVQIGAKELGDEFASQAVEILLHAHARPDIAAREGGMAPIHRAARSGMLKTILTFFRHSPDTVNLRTNKGLTVLHYVAQWPTNKFPDLKEVLHDLVIDGVTKDGNTAAHYAGACRRRETLDYLYSLGFRRDLRNACGFTPEDKFRGRGRIIDGDISD
ncbi:hypothetical protein PAPYR_6699 [Paratrimastix pyriformis]|uniref:Ankyrin n=1 Tax=Paratrimastix pyriformis TaxID=342808 RepID=A0ABQ8UEU3_9EUKA|nr:hypothetical protein PAPYR_6699 [Paratrimastix pyriformis]